MLIALAEIGDALQVGRDGRWRKLAQRLQSRTAGMPVFSEWPTVEWKETLHISAHVRSKVNRRHAPDEREHVMHRLVAD